MFSSSPHSPLPSSSHEILRPPRSCGTSTWPFPRIVIVVSHGIGTSASTESFRSKVWLLQVTNSTANTPHNIHDKCAQFLAEIPVHLAFHLALACCLTTTSSFFCSHLICPCLPSFALSSTTLPLLVKTRCLNPLSSSKRAYSRSFPFNNAESAPPANTSRSYPSNLASDRCVGAVDPKQASSLSDVGELQPGTPFTIYHSPHTKLVSRPLRIASLTLHRAFSSRPLQCLQHVPL